MLNYRHLSLLPMLLALGLALAACGDSQSDASPTPTAAGATRTFAMGLSSLPPELTEESYADAFELAASTGEVILMRHTPPWEDLLTGDLSDDVIQTTQREIDLAEEHDLDIFFAIDATDVSEENGQLAGLPDDLLGTGFADEELRQALVSYAQYVALNYQPTYLALGLDVNGYQGQNPEDFEEFVTGYHEAYEAIKELSPETLVFPTFQLEELQGLLPLDEPREPQWQLIERFAPRMDLLAVSTYPGVAFSDPEQIPPDYYTQLTSYTDRPIAIAEMGYPSEAGEDGQNEGTEAQQIAFLERALDDAEQLDMPLVVWFAGHDPTFTDKGPFDLVQHIGLLRQDGSKKPAWAVWSRTARRPLAEAGARAR